MYKNVVIILATELLALSVFSCSHCALVPNASFQELKQAKNLQLEIKTMDGTVFVTRKFIIKTDGIIIKDSPTTLGEVPKPLRVPFDNIISVRYCEFNTERAVWDGLKFAFWLSLPFVLLWILFKDMGPTGISG